MEDTTKIQILLPSAKRKASSIETLGHGIELTSSKLWFQWNAGSRGGKKKWTYYDRQLQMILRAAYRRGDAWVDIEVWGCLYTVFLRDDAMRQVKHDTAYERQVRTTSQHPDLTAVTQADADQSSTKIAKSSTILGTWSWRQAGVSTSTSLVTQETFDHASQRSGVWLDEQAEEHSKTHAITEDSSGCCDWRPTWHYLTCATSTLPGAGGPVWARFEDKIQKIFRRAFDMGEHEVRVWFKDTCTKADLRLALLTDLETGRQVLLKCT